MERSEIAEQELSTLIGAFPAGDQSAPWASVDVGGGGGGGGCTAGVFSDRASFEAAFTGTLNLEDFRRWTRSYYSL